MSTANTEGTWLDLARAIFPDKSDATLDGYLWGFTGFPCFWDGDPATECRRQLTEARERLAAGYVMGLGGEWERP